jgi:hypothetical protein
LRITGSKAIPKSTKTAPNCARAVIFFPAAPFIPEWQIFKLLCESIGDDATALALYQTRLSIITGDFEAGGVRPAVQGDWGLADDDGQSGWRAE